MGPALSEVIADSGTVVIADSRELDQDLEVPGVRRAIVRNQLEHVAKHVAIARVQTTLRCVRRAGLREQSTRSQPVIVLQFPREVTNDASKRRPAERRLALASQTIESASIRPSAASSSGSA